MENKSEINLRAKILKLKRNIRLHIFPFLLILPHPIYLSLLHCPSIPIILSSTASLFSWPLPPFPFSYPSLSYLFLSVPLSLYPIILPFTASLFSWPLPPSLPSYPSLSYLFLSPPLSFYPIILPSTASLFSYPLPPIPHHLLVPFPSSLLTSALEKKLLMSGF